MVRLVGRVMLAIGSAYSLLGTVKRGLRLKSRSVPVTKSTQVWGLIMDMLLLGSQKWVFTHLQLPKLIV